MSPFAVAERLPRPLLDGLTAVTVAMAAAVVVVAVARALRAGPGALSGVGAQLGLALEFLLASGLVRLGSTTTYGALAVVASIVGLRQLIVRGLRAAARAAPSGPAAGRAGRGTG